MIEMSSADEIAQPPLRNRRGIIFGTLAIDRNPRLSCGDGQTSTHVTPDGLETLWARGGYDGGSPAEFRDRQTSPRALAAAVFAAKRPKNGGRGRATTRTTKT